MSQMLKIKRLTGFTFPELLLTAAILAYALSAILLTYVNSVALNEASRNLVSANSHAEYVMESIKSSAFSGLAASITAGNWTWNTAAVTSHGLTALNSESITTSSTGTNPLDVTVTVSWKDTHARNRTKTLRSLIAG